MLYKRREKLKLIKKLESAAAKIFVKLPFSPNFYTSLSILFALFGLILVYSQYILLALMFYLIALSLDFIDGAVARAKKMVSKKGAYLDTILDRWVEIIILLSFLFLPLPEFIFPPAIWIFLLMAGSLMTTYTKAAAKEKDVVKKEIRGGILERGERTCGIMLALFLYRVDAFYSVLVISILAILSLITSLQRFFSVIRKV